MGGGSLRPPPTRTNDRKSISISQWALATNGQFAATSGADNGVARSQDLAPNGRRVEAPRRETPASTPKEKRTATPLMPTLPSTINQRPAARRLVWVGEFNFPELDERKWRFLQLGSEPCRESVSSHSSVVASDGRLRLKSHVVSGALHSGKVGTSGTLERP